MLQLHVVHHRQTGSPNAHNLAGSRRTTLSVNFRHLNVPEKAAKRFHSTDLSSSTRLAQRRKQLRASNPSDEKIVQLKVEIDNLVKELGLEKWLEHQLRQQMFKQFYAHLFLLHFFGSIFRIHYHDEFIIKYVLFLTILDKIIIIIKKNYF